MFGVTIDMSLHIGLIKALSKVPSCERSVASKSWPHLKKTHCAAELMMSFASGSEALSASLHTFPSLAADLGHIVSLMHSAGNIFLLKQKESHLDLPARLDVLACLGFLIIVIKGNGLNI